jgi:hypothetical protein
MTRCVSVLVALLLLCAGAVAQSGPFDDAGPYGLPLTRRSLAVYTGMLGLDADQKAAARALHDAYLAAFRDATKQAQAKREAVPTGDFEVRGKQLAELSEVFVEQTRALERELLQDLQAICTPGQAERFPAVERARRRETGSFLPLAAGDGVDLVLLFQAINLPGSPEAAETLERWSIRVDQIEQERERTLRSWMPKMIAKNNSPRAGEDRDKLFGELYAISAMRRDATRRAVRELQAALPEADYQKLEKELAVRSFPRIYGRSPALALLDDALGLASLVPEQKQQLQQLRDAYEKEAAPLNARWAAAAEEKQGQLATNFSEVNAQITDPPADDPFFTLSRQRRELDRSFIERARGVLKEDQRSRLGPELSSSGPPEFLPDIGGMIEQGWEDMKEE